jgi:hypothetical protein
MTEAQRLKKVLRERVEELARYLFPNGRREGNYWCVGDITGVPGKSFKICLAGEKVGMWGDFNGSEKHSRNPLDLWMAARGVDFKTALREAAKWTGYELHSTNGEKPLPSKSSPTPIFRTIAHAIARVEHRLKMQATRRDSYRSRNGNEQFIVVRFEADNRKKEFRPFHRSASGWVMSDPPGKLPLFRLPELLGNPSDRIFVVEGEKCACALATLGAVATTSAHGGKCAGKTEWGPLAGREVVILPDNDEEGRGYAQTVAGILSRLTPPAMVKILELPELPEKGDCVDWLDAQDAQTPEDIRAELFSLAENLAENAREIASPASAVQPAYEVAEDNSEMPGRKSAATRLIELASAFHFFHDPQDRPFVRLKINGPTEVWPVESSKFRKLLAREYYKRIRKAINRNASRCDHDACRARVSRWARGGGFFARCSTGRKHPDRPLRCSMARCRSHG